MASKIKAYLMILLSGKEGQTIWKIVEDEDYKNHKEPELFCLGEPSEFELCHGLQAYGWRIYTHFYDSLNRELLQNATVTLGFCCRDDEIQAAAIRLTDQRPSENDGQNSSRKYEYIPLPELCVDDIEGADEWEPSAEAAKWFRMPLESRIEKKLHPKDGYSNYIERIHDRENYLTAVGLSEICFGTNENNRFEIKEVYRLFTDVTPGIGMEQYDRMVDDLVSIYEDMIYSEGSNQTSGIRFQSEESAGEELLKKLEHMEYYLQAIEKAPEKELYPEEQKVELHKVHRYSSGILRAYGSGNTEKIPVTIYHESNNLYEHRMIRKYLYNLRGRIARRVIHSHSIDEKGSSSKPQIVNRYERIFQIQLDNLKNLESPVERRTEAQEETSFLYAEIIKGENGFELNWSESANQYWCQVAPQDEWEYLTRLTYTPEHGERILYGTKYNITITTTGGFFDALYYAYIIQLINQGKLGSDKITLVGNGIVDRKEREDGKPFPQYVHINYHKLRKVVYGAGCVYEVTYDVFIRRLLQEESFRQEICGLYLALNMKENELMDYYLDKQAESDKERQERNNRIWSEVIKRTEHMLSGYECLQVPDSMEPLHGTNLFLKGRNYRDLYRIMREEQKRFDCIDIMGDVRTRVRAAQNIFEKWGLFAMLHFFENIGFHTKMPIAQELKAYFQNPQAQNKETRYVLTHDDFYCPLSVEVIYQAKVRSAMNGREYSPDFIWKITWNNRVKYVILDTKYKDFRVQGKEVWEEELVQVAYYKYLCGLQGGELMRNGQVEDRFSLNNLCGVYILHPSYSDPVYEEIALQDNRIRVRSSDYYGQGLEEYLSVLRQEPHDHSIMAINDRMFIRKGEKSVDWELRQSMISLWDNTPAYREFGRIGSIAIRPGNMEYLMNLFRMIMEHFFDVDSTVCWRCGSSDIDKLPKNGVGSAFHCKNCEEFWVVTWCQNKEAHPEDRPPIRKHYLNYYFRDPRDNKWNIICPICGGKYEKGRGIPGDTDEILDIPDDIPF